MQNMPYMRFPNIHMHKIDRSKNLNTKSLFLESFK